MKHFRFQLVIRVLLIFITLALLAFMVYRTELVAATVFMGILAVLQMVALIRFVEQTNVLLNRFFSAFNYDDFSLHLSSSSEGKSFEALEEVMNHVMDRFRGIRSEREQGYRYLDQVIQHAGVAMISFDEKEAISLINHSAKRLFNASQIKHLDDLPSVIQSYIRSMNHGEKRVVKLDQGLSNMQLVLLLTEFKLAEKPYRLVSFQNIRAEIDETEQLAWQKLIRVMTHEIMNSVTSISTLGAALKGIFFKEGEYQGQLLNEADQEDAGHAMEVIQQRSEGLLQFVESYRNLSKIPDAQFQVFSVKKLFEDLEKLLKTQFENEQIVFSKEVLPEGLELISDPQLLEQVLINLLINGMHAMEDTSSKVLKLEAQQSKGKIEVTVTDTGMGIEEELFEQIFIPFFSSKKEGSGIGLSISRQIVQRLGGEMEVSTEVGKGSCFRIILPT